MFGIGKIFWMFLKEVFYAHQGCIYLNENAVKAAIFWNVIITQNICFLFEYLKL